MHGTLGGAALCPGLSCRRLSACREKPTAIMWQACSLQGEAHGYYVAGLQPAQATASLRSRLGPGDAGMVLDRSMSVAVLIGGKRTVQPLLTEQWHAISGCCGRGR